MLSSLSILNTLLGMGQVTILSAVNTCAQRKERMRSNDLMQNLW